jgi:UDP-glucose 4-epimerase
MEKETLSLHNKTILVTGGAGFIGSHLLETLVKDFPSSLFFSLDNYFTGTEKNHTPGVTYIIGDTMDIDTHIKISPHVVFHLGEYSRVEKSFDDMEKVFTYNKIGTFSVLEFCRKHNAKLIYAGSSTKFGDGGAGRDQSPYAWTKATNTELVINYGVWFGLRHAITYFYNVYGKREISKGPYATVIGIFKEKSKNKELLQIVTPGTQLRNFTHIDDIVRGLILVGEQGEGDNYGLGSDNAYSILDIANMFGLPIEMLPERKGNRMSAPVNTQRAKNELGWSAKNTIDEYIRSIKVNES